MDPNPRQLRVPRRKPRYRPRFHDLRHHGATMALNVNAGFTAPIMMALGGWKRERMMRRYAAVTDKTLRRPLRQWRETVTTQSTN